MGCIVVNEAHISMVENLGKFDRIILPGFHCINPITEQIAHTRSMQLMSSDIMIETATKDSVYIKIKIGIQYRIMNSDAEMSHHIDDIELNNEVDLLPKQYNTFSNYQKEQPSYNRDPRYRAIYLTATPQLQITQHVEAYFREIGCNYEMREMFLSKSKLTDDLVHRLNREMNQFGYIIHKVLITDIDPPRHIKESMDLVLSAQNERDAMVYSAEAKKKASILVAEGQAEVRRLEGLGIAQQRMAISEGLKTSITNFGGDAESLDARELTKTIVTMQYIDMLHNIGTSGKSTFIIPSNVNNIEEQIRTGIMSTQ